MIKLKQAGMMAAAVVLAAAGVASAYIATGGGPCNVGPSGPIPPNCTYRTPQQIHSLGLADQVAYSAEHGGFVNQTSHQGGIFNGTVESFDSTVILHIDGIKDYTGATATVKLPAHCETHIGPRDVKADFQRFDTAMYSIQGGASDENFESIKIVGGEANGMPSPGSTTLTRNRQGGFLVDSTFQMNFHIELVGRKGGKFDGVNISEDGTATVKAYANETAK
ncbi:MAG: hypothetical protein ABUT39_02380 [Acidobacteriota bacterium]